MPRYSRPRYLWYRFLSDRQHRKADKILRRLTKSTLSVSEQLVQAQYLYWPKVPVEYLGHPVAFAFFTGRLVITTGEEAYFDVPPIPAPVARLADRVLTRLPTLLPAITSAIKRYDANLSDEVMREKLDCPSVIFDSEGNHSGDIWTFQIDHDDLGCGFP
jgi:hypothetical protein